MSSDPVIITPGIIRDLDDQVRNTPPPPPSPDTLTPEGRRLLAELQAVRVALQSRQEQAQELSEQIGALSASLRTTGHDVMALRQREQRLKAAITGASDEQTRRENAARARTLTKLQALAQDLAVRLQELGLSAEVAESVVGELLTRANAILVEEREDTGVLGVGGVTLRTPAR